MCILYLFHLKSLLMNKSKQYLYHVLLKILYKNSFLEVLILFLINYIYFYIKYIFLLILNNYIYLLYDKAKIKFHIHDYYYLPLQFKIFDYLYYNDYRILFIIIYKMYKI